jgi:hypothetical protein
VLLKSSQGGKGLGVESAGGRLKAHKEGNSLFNIVFLVQADLRSTSAFHIIASTHHHHTLGPLAHQPVKLHGSKVLTND